MASRSALTDRQLALALGSLADALAAGVSLTSHLAAELSTTPPGLRESLTASLRRGLGLSDALKQAEVLSEAELGLMRAGEQSGRVVPTLRLLADAIEERRKLRWQLGLGLAYPCFLVSCASLILPVPRLVTEGLGGYLRVAVWGPLGVAALAIVLFVVAPRVSPKSSVRRWAVSAGRSIPVMGGGLRMLAHATVARVLGHNLAAGLPLPQSVGGAFCSSGDPGLERSCPTVLGALAHGRSLHEALAATNHFDPSFLGVVATAERSGTLDSALPTLAASLQESGGRRIKLAIAGAALLVLAVTVIAIVRSIVCFWAGYFGA